MTSIFKRVWARVENGFIVELKEAAHELAHPFELVKGEVAVDVTKVNAVVGMHVDNKGNVAAIPNRNFPLGDREPAYHDRSNPAPVNTADRERKLQTAEPLPHDKGAQERAAFVSQSGVQATVSPKSPAGPDDTSSSGVPVDLAQSPAAPASNATPAVTDGDAAKSAADKKAA